MLRIPFLHMHSWIRLSAPGLRRPLLGVLGFACALGLRLEAQTHAFRRFDGRDGLPQSQVRVLMQDHQGFLWVGTHGGVARLGASGFKSYGLAQGLGIGRVRALLEDRRGAIWVAQTDAGLARIEGSQVRNFTAADGLKEKNCYALELDASGAVLVATSAGVHRFDGRGFRPLELGPWSTEPVYGLARAATGLWMSTRHGRIGRWDGHGVEEERLPGNGSQREVWKLQVDPSGNLWALTRPGLYRRDAGVWTAVALAGYSGNPKLQDFGFDRQGSLLVGLGDEGLWMRGPDGSTTWWTAKDGLPEEQINLAFRDSDGILWIGTNGEGLYAQVLPSLSALKGDPPMELGAVLAMEPLPGGALFGTSRGLFQWVEGKGLTARWAVKDGLPANEIWSLFPDGQGGMWLGSAKGMMRWKDGRVIPPRLLGDARVFQMVRWRTSLFVGTDRGLSELDASGKVKRIFEMPKEAGVNDAYVLLGGEDGVLVGCSKGLYRFDGTRLARAYPEAPFAAARVISLYRDAKGALWAGTVQGLYRLDSAGWTPFSLDQGLPDAHIYFVGDGGNGRIAVGHGKGVSLLQPSGEFIHLNQNVGLISDETNQGSVRMDDRGRLWFGMINGVCFLDTRQPLLLPPVKTPTVQEVSWSGGRSYLPAKLDLPPRPEFAEFNFELGMPIAARAPIYEVRLEGQSEDWQRTGEGHVVRYGGLGAGTYRFQVRASQDGVHWSEGPALAMNVRPTWYEHPAGRLAMLALGFTLVMVFIQWRTRRLKKAAALLEAKVEERTRSLDQRNQELEAAHGQVKELLEAKVTFTRMVVHDLRSPITSINLLAELMETQAADRGEDPPPQLQIMSKEAARLEGLLKRLLDQSRSEAVDQTLHMIPAKPQKLLEGMEEVLRLKAEGAGLRFSWEVEPVEVRVLADALAIQQILLNLIGNALKVTPPGGSVGVRSGLREGAWVMEVWDTGRGFDPGQVGRLFQPFTQVEIGDIGKGWGLGLSIVKALVDGHGATIAVGSELGRGTTFHIAFPLMEKVA